MIDATSPTPRRGQTILIRGNRIVAVGPKATTSVPLSARAIDATGKVVIPGLWDMHTHIDIPGGEELLAAYVVNGVTGVRDMASEWGTITKWRRAIADGALLGPRITASGPYLEGNPQPIAHIAVKSVDDARRGVDSLKTLGVDVIKFHTGLTRETFFAAARRAREVGMPFAGHVPRTISAIEASDSGMRSIEHALTIPTPCTPAESLALVPKFPVQRVLGPCSSAPLTPTFATLARNTTWVTPTFVAAYEIAEWPQRALPGDAYAKYLPDTLKKFVAWIFPMPDSIPPGSERVGRTMFNKRVALAGAMHRAGVHLLAGTDSPLRNSPPGFGLAEELVLLARGGVPLHDVLKIATLEPGRFFSATDSIGTVQPGRFADLVILDRNPLADARNYRSVSAVVANGRVFTKMDRDAILARLEAAGKAQP
ncbi:MAG: amidohydrolase family protein [Gemmatimonadota bacterium]|nr:amidohydrolase family protein [Gemmatimonadota bacterium]